MKAEARANRNNTTPITLVGVGGGQNCGSFVYFLDTEMKQQFLKAPVFVVCGVGLVFWYFKVFDFFPEPLLGPKRHEGACGGNSHLSKIF